MEIKDEDIPNLKNLLLKHKKDGEEKSSSNFDKSSVEQVLEILKDKLKNNLTKTPSIYQFS
jgi:hypothetical protein